MTPLPKRWAKLKASYARACRLHKGQRRAWDKLHRHVNRMLRMGK